MARKKTLTLCARISPEGDALRTELLPCAEIRA